jgi:hypothetical protein
MRATPSGEINPVRMNRAIHWASMGAEMILAPRTTIVGLTFSGSEPRLDEEK